ncbi:PIR Superfamily Protein [Plasmodium ovale curtisi]|uniref:PIR Superfamily Protein n=1 Tax=Plasmodium ovale curtisi TaxID=864141 RepID=A0A1A8X784_PLAOA|nr:PIR Superfamily Protein [Plasmodium ovale curtisi]
MPENPKDDGFEFFDKLTKGTLSANKELEEYYNRIESLYNENSIFVCGHDAEVADCEDSEAIVDHQGSYSDKSFHNDQTYHIFLSKFTNALGKLINQYYASSSLQHDHSKQCVYFKYWFYDKILKNIFSNKKLKDFYAKIKEGDEEDKSVCEAAEEQHSNDTDELIEQFLEQSEEEEDEIVQASSEDSDEDMSEDENQPTCKDGECCNKKILLSLGKSNSCNIYKLKLNQIRNIKLLYDYLEDDKSNNRSSAKEKISKSTYCSFFNETIELYKEKSKCRIYNLNNEYCQEVEKCKNIYPLTNGHILECAKSESTSGSPQRSSNNEELQEATTAPSPPGSGASSDNSPSGDLSHAVSENLKEVADVVSTTQHTPGDMIEKHTLDAPEHITVPDHPNTQVASSADVAGSYSMDSKTLNSCHNGNVGRTCESSLQELAAMPTETVNNLKQLRQENTNINTEPDTGLQEETGNTNTIVSSASSVLGVSALAFMLYKFTPLGSLINNRRGGIDTWDINEEPYDENLLFSSALGNTNSNNNNYSIGYYSLGNT